MVSVSPGKKRTVYGSAACFLTLCRFWKQPIPEYLNYSLCEINADSIIVFHVWAPYCVLVDTQPSSARLEESIHWVGSGH